MITFENIRTTVTRNLKTNFNGLKVSSKSVNKGFTRPSFKVELDNVKREGYLTQVEKSCTVRIFYFPADENDSTIELLDVQEKIGDLFDLKFSVEGRHLDIVEPYFDEIDGVLQFEFDLLFFDGREYENEDIGIEDEIKNGKDFYEKYPIELMGELVEEGD
ncbi:hypothetical protein B1B04_22265 [Lysinibacillus sp. KCTC 33748]|uniref:phage tail terminator family protein n=1 Tax=unclassified Lysinibacillus TaxID=2636778 RepID=UPI0009A8ECA1|nr:MULTISPECIES: hypothetical protein [unclassified Lysinibacillus]OXS67519.1 hypothetical protein B1B04_22265 [Lysinibacillus sp. KCTC 33748]SKC14394.1 hypothetical protein SAMN06295926_12819 [Lysinibacillus sp. AC-3]